VDLDEAFVILFRGQSNVAVLARKLDIPQIELEEAFRGYVKITPIDEDIWRGDVELAWPWA